MKSRMLPRDAGGSFTLDGGTGPVTATCNCGDFLEVYKVDTTFRVKSPESIDPQRTNPNAPWVASVSDNVGSAHHAVARVLLQGQGLLDGAMLKSTINKIQVVRLLHTIKEELLACDKVASRVKNAVEAIVAQMQANGLPTDSRLRMLNPFPQVANLDAEATSFLIHAKRAIQTICSLPPFFIEIPDKDTNFDHLARTVGEKLGADSRITQFILNRAPMLRHLVDLRNFQEHPKQRQTVVTNFYVAPNGHIGLPQWHVSDSTPRSIHEEMSQAIAFLIETAELLFAYLVVEAIDQNWPMVIVQIPETERNPNAPVRLRISIDMSQVTIRTETDSGENR